MAEILFIFSNFLWWQLAGLTFWFLCLAGWELSEKYNHAPSRSKLSPITKTTVTQITVVSWWDPILLEYRHDYTHLKRLVTLNPKILLSKNLDEVWKSYGSFRENGKHFFVVGPKFFSFFRAQAWLYFSESFFPSASFSAFHFLFRPHRTLLELQAPPLGSLTSNP